MNLVELHLKAKRLFEDKARGHLLLEHEETRSRLTRSRLKNLATANRYAAQALARGGPQEVDAAELTEENLLIIENWLQAQGKNHDTVYNALSNLRFERDLAVELGVQVWIAPKLGRPQRGRVYIRQQGGGYTKLAKTPYIADNSAYGLRYVEWPAHLKREFEEGILPFFTDPLATKRSSRRPASPKYMKTWLNRAERAFGFLIMLGVPKEELSFRRLADYQTMFTYHKWLFQRRGDRHTLTTKGDLEQWRHLAASYFNDRKTGDRLTELIRKKTHFVTIKDKGQLVINVHADDLYSVLFALIGEAEHYEANVHRKYDRRFPMALAAHKWMEAGVWAITLVTWLREGNVAMMTSKNLYKLGDGTWHFRFAGDEMKSKRDHADYVLDLWKGDEVQGLINRVLDKVVEMRPHLVKRFRANHPGLPDPETFFLNMKGRPYAENALRHFFTSASVRYLGPEKRISFHDVRTIVPTWLAVREGVGILPTLQRRLDHARFQTTQNFYLKVERVFDSRLAKLQMEEREKHRKTQERLAKLPDQMAGMFQRLQAELLAAHADFTGSFTEETLRTIVLEAVHGALGVRPEQPRSERPRQTSEPYGSNEGGQIG